jgi:hypothetical protein
MALGFRLGEAPLDALLVGQTARVVHVAEEVLGEFVEADAGDVDAWPRCARRATPRSLVACIAGDAGLEVVDVVLVGWVILGNSLEWRSERSTGGGLGCGRTGHGGRPGATASSRADVSTMPSGDTVDLPAGASVM